MVNLDALQAEIAALIDPRDIPGNWSARERDAYEMRRQHLTRKFSLATAAIRELADVEPKLDMLSKQKADLDAVREELCTELLTLPPRSRDRAVLDRQYALKVSILTCDGRFSLDDIELPKNFPLFDKLRARGYTRGAPYAEWNLMTVMYGSLPTMDYRLTALQRQRDDAQRMLDAALDAVTR